MKRPSSLSLRRTAETDATVLMLAGLVFVLLLLVGGGGMMVMWYWRQTERAQMMAQDALMQAREAEEQARWQADRAMRQERGAVRRQDDLLFRESTHVGGLVGASAVSPWPTLALVPVGMDDQ